MGRKGDQEGLPGIPQQPKRKIIEEIEEISLEIDKMAGKRTAMSDAIAEKVAERQAMLLKHKDKLPTKDGMPVYTYQDANDVLQDVQLENVTKKRKSKLNPKKAKEAGE